MKTFAIVLKDLMEDRSVDAKTLAETLELATSVIYKWLNGEKSLLLSTAVKLADYFNCSLDYLVGRREDFENTDFSECPPFDVQLRKILGQSKVSQYKLVKDEIVSRGNLYNWLCKKQTPHIESIIKLADYFSCSVDEFVGRG